MNTRKKFKIKFNKDKDTKQNNTKIVLLIHHTFWATGFAEADNFEQIYQI